MEIMKTVCNGCTTNCGMNVYVENGKVVKVTGMPEHSLKTLCVKGYAVPELVHSTERLTEPMRRVNGSWQQISWDEAFDFIADKLTSIKQRYGAKAVVTYGQFQAILAQRVMRRFTDLYGSPNYVTRGSFCFLARVIGHSLTCGAFVSPYYSERTECMLVWGKNPGESFPAQADAINAELGRGGKLIVIDVRKTSLARKADIHAQVRPGTDCALALGMLNVIITEGLYDKDFVRDWTVGFDKLAEHVKGYSPERVEEITWVPAETVKKIARMYATNKPAYISLGISMDHCTNGIQTIRAISSLIAITGNLDIPGGNIYVPRLQQTNLRVEEKVGEDMGIGAEYPLYTKYSLEQTVTPLAGQILTEKPYPIKGLLLSGGNPILTWPNTNKVIKALQKLDLLVVVDIFMTDTAELADIVLPGTTFLERQDIRTYAFHGADALFVYNNRTIEPVGNSMEEWKIWAELGRRMGYGEYFPWRDSDEIVEYLLKPSGLTLQQVKQNPQGVHYAEQEFQKYLKNGFNTPSKKVELYSETMEKLGYDPLPTFHEPAESPVSRPDLAEKYPLSLITGPRTMTYLHSQFHNLPGLRRLVPEPLIEIHPQTAGNLGIADGDLVEVESLRGSIKLRARLTEDISPQVVSVQHGWSEANANILTDDEARDPISGYPSFRSVLVRVTKANV